MATNVELPAGFTLDPEPSSELPEGFTLDIPEDERLELLDLPGDQEQSYSEEPLSASELAKGAAETLLESSLKAIPGMAGYLQGSIEGVFRRFIEEGFTPEQAAQLAQETAAQYTKGLYTPDSKGSQKVKEAIGDITDALPPVPLAPTASTQFALNPINKQGLMAATDRAISKIPGRKVSQEKQNIAANLASNDVSLNDAAGFELKEPDVNAGALKQLARKVVPESPIQKSKAGSYAVKQGFDEGLVADLSKSSAKTKNIAKAMVNDLERGQKSSGYKALNRPLKRVGELLADRIKTVRAANKQAGRDIDKVATGLKNKQVDILQPLVNFNDALENVGVRVVNNNGERKLDFSRSELPPGDRKPINEVIRNMNIFGEKEPSAFDAHKMKRIIDNNISYGKVKTGTSKTAENILKNLRAELDQALDGQFPAYDKANSVYAKTITGLNNIQDSLGRKIDLNNPAAIGQETRKILSNYRSGNNILESLQEIQDLAETYANYGNKKLGKKSFDDDLVTLVRLNSDLERLFDAAPENSFAKQSGQQVVEAINDLKSNDLQNMTLFGALAKGGKAAYDSVNRVNNKNRLKAIKQLIDNN